MASAALLCLFFLVGAGSLRAATPSYSVHAPSEDGELLLVQAVFRHGARTPLSTMFWPDSRYANCSDQYPGPELRLRDETGLPDAPPILDMGMPKLPGGCRMGQLTYTGHNQAVDLGAWLRRRYIEVQPALLPRTFQAPAMSLRSTCIARAVQTLQGVLEGLYPGQQGPIHVNASLEQYEFEYGKNTTCPALAPILHQIESLLATRDRTDPELQRQAGIVRAALGLPPGDSLSWVRLHDVLAAMRAEGLPLPAGVSADLWRVIDQQAVAHEAPHVGPIPQYRILDEGECKRVIRMSVGPLVWRIISNLQAAAARALSRASAAAAAAGANPDDDEDEGLVASIEEQDETLRRQRRLRSGEAAAAGAAGAAGAPAPAPAMYLYSGHDSTITPLLVALGQPETTWPPFTANLVFELTARRRPAAAALAARRAAGKAVVAAGGAAAAAAAGPPLEFDVRVLYNGEVMKLQGSRPGGWVDLPLFTKTLMHSFGCSDEEKAAMCSRVPAAAAA